MFDALAPQTCYKKYCTYIAERMELEDIIWKGDGEVCRPLSGKAMDSMP